MGYFLLPLGERKRLAAPFGYAQGGFSSQPRYKARKRMQVGSLYTNPEDAGRIPFS